MMADPFGRRALLLPRLSSANTMSLETISLMDELYLSGSWLQSFEQLASSRFMYRSSTEIIYTSSAFLATAWPRGMFKACKTPDWVES